MIGTVVIGEQTFTIQSFRLVRGFFAIEILVSPDVWNRWTAHGDMELLYAVFGEDGEKVYLGAYTASGYMKPPCVVSLTLELTIRISDNAQRLLDSRAV